VDLSRSRERSFLVLVLAVNSNPLICVEFAEVRSRHEVAGHFLSERQRARQQSENKPLSDFCQFVP
jgi:hypothetical protein